MVVLGCGVVTVIALAPPPGHFKALRGTDNPVPRNTTAMSGSSAKVRHVA
jgi:hypothetical protein